jgi:serine/threonine protein kinase
MLHGYAIEHRIGEGGMGVVYRARELDSNRVVALKLLKHVDPRGIYKFKREFRTLAEIAHTNLVSLYELQCADNQWFFTMELVEGASFVDFVGSDPWRTFEPRSGETESVDGSRSTRASGVSTRPTEHVEARLRDGFSQLARGLMAVHRAGKIHCDVKPTNVMVNAGGRVVLLDFGISSVFGGSDPFTTLDSGIEGTPEYMSPEQILREPLSPSSDFYALGVMLYEVLAGTRPFVGSRSTLLANKLGGLPPPPSALRPDIPKDLEELCMELLARTPNARPTGEQILAKLEQPASSTAAHAVQSTRPFSRSPASHPSELDGRTPGDLERRGHNLVGRTQEMAWLRGAANDVASQRQVIALVTGASGIGKTELVSTFARELMAKPGALVLRARCYESESVPYKAFDPVIDELARFLCRLSDRDVAELLPRDIRTLACVFPVLNRVDAIATAGGRAVEGDLVEVRRRASRALKELLARLADRWHLSIVIDDLHWGDVDSARLLLDILEPPDGPVLFVLLVARDVHSQWTPMLRFLLESEGVPMTAPLIRSLRAEPLPLEEVLTLARALMGSDASPEVLATLARESAGNPFFLHELARYAEANAATTDRLDTESLRLEPLLRRRIESLRSDLRQTLEMVAIAGRPVSQDLIARVDGRSPMNCMELREARLVRTTGPTSSSSIECYHDRIRETTIAAMTPERRSACHRTLALALEAEGRADPEVLLEHYVGANETDSARRHVVAAAEAARRALAFSRAARLYRMAIDLAPAGEWDRAALQVRLAESLALEGRLKEAGEAYGKASQWAQGLDAIEQRRLSAEHLLTSGDLVRGLETLKKVLSDVSLTYPTTPAAALARLGWARAKLRFLGLRFKERSAAEVPPQELARVDICFSAAVGLAMNDLVRAAAFSAEHLTLALAIGEPTRIARGLAFEMGLAPGAGEEGLRWASRALPIAESLSNRNDDAYLRGMFFLSQGHVAYFRGQWRAAVDWLTRADGALRSSHATAVEWAVQSANVLECQAAAIAGDLLTVEMRLPTVVKEARRRGDVHSLSLFAYPSILVHLARDRADAARAWLRETTRERSSDATFELRDFTTLHCALLVDRYEGKPQLAWTRLSECWPAIVRSKILVVNVARTTVLAERGTAALAMAHGGDTSYLRIAKDCAKRLARERLHYPRALAGLLRARIAHVSGDGARALRELNEASLELETVGLTRQAICSRRVIGSMMGGTMGRALASEMDSTLRQQGVQNPARFVELMVPGFGAAPDPLRTDRGA